MISDWRNGFLFLGNSLALDFLNTRPVMDGEPQELLGDAEALARWLAAAGLVSESQAAELGRRWKGPRAAAALRKLRDLREELRRAVLDMEAGKPPPPAFVRQINRLLAAHPAVEQVVEGSSGLERRQQFTLDSPEEVFAPVADGIAELLTGIDRSRLRKCRQCVLHFYDTSKKGTRIWCSMNLCGNRAKVAAFAERKRSAE